MSVSVPSTHSDIRWLTWARLVSLGVFAAVVVRWAWIGDDALITLRTALNATHGWGWGFNSTEAVQGYTHPLWFAAVAVVGAVSNQWIVGIIALSVVFALGAAGIVLWRIESVAGVIRFTAAIVTSNAVVEYATSGLETPLSYLLVAALLVSTLRLVDAHTAMSARSALGIGALLGLIVLNRFDLLLLTAPAVGYLAWQQRHRVRAVGVMFGSFAAILIAWLTFSWLTYGALLPNTFYAKTNLDIPRHELLIQGMRYWYVTLLHDPASGLVLLAATALVIVGGSRLSRIWLLGIVLTAAYWTWVGGDFMAGRLLAVPVLVSAALIGLIPDHKAATRPDWRPASGRALDPALVSAIAVAIVIPLLLPFSNAFATTLPSEERWSTEQSAGVADELGVYAKSGRMLKDFIVAPGNAEYVRDRGPAVFPTNEAEVAANADKVATWQTDLLALDRFSKIWPTNEGNAALVAVTTSPAPLGAVGIVTGPNVHIVDIDALVDAFLARQPYTASGFEWRVGHFSRPVPDGYLEAIGSGDPTKLVDPALVIELHELWQRIRS